MTKSLLYIVLYAVLNVCGAAIIKYQLKGTKLAEWNDWLKLLFNIPFVAAFSLIILSAMALFKALSTNQFSVVIPIATGINFILTIAVGYFMFQDKLSILSYVGFFLIIGGVLVLSINNQAHV
jgi:multidrug transporter EmrE-like cation transporter